MADRDKEISAADLAMLVAALKLALRYVALAAVYGAEWEDLIFPALTGGTLLDESLLELHRRIEQQKLVFEETPLRTVNAAATLRFPRFAGAGPETQARLRRLAQACEHALRDEGYRVSQDKVRAINAPGGELMLGLSAFDPQHTEHDDD